ncbi:UPF0182 family protein [Streptomyces sp. V4-01]|uniref:UPF0182 protein V2S66_14675 n=1 Tax=Actinacidiphila polyblastidii TaxID=3110430 RepID=A0ABU7PBM6_9ACTN|nr:UPF0182 family protein [Streptomyces sp. V4-01]
MRTLVFQMPDRDGGPTGPRAGFGRPSRRARTLVTTIGVLALLMIVFVTFAGLWTDLLWYRSVHYSSVFTTTLWTKVGLFCSFGLLMSVAIGVNVYLAHRLRPPLSAMSAEQQGLDRYRMGVAPYKTWVLLGICAVVGLIAGGSASAHWRLWLLYTNATSFHTKDPQFHKDVSFYAFDLPWYRFLLAFGFAAVVLSLIAAALVHYLYGGLRLTAAGGGRATGAATGHLSVLLGVFVSLKAVAYWLDRYGLAVKSSGLRSTDDWTGLRYVDANAYLPAKTILFFIAAICAVLFFATLWRRTWSLPMIGFGLMVLSAILIGGLYPAIVQKFQVQPNEAAKEAPYIQKNIDATRAAYGIKSADVSDYSGTSGTANPALRADTATAASIRLLDPDVVAPTFQQMQQSGSYYSFPSTLDVDRYTVDGKKQDTVVGVRELDSDGIPEKNWINDHFKYTHGYGIVAAKSTEVTGGDADSSSSGSGTGAGSAGADGAANAAGLAGNPNGQPVYTEHNLPTTGAMGPYTQQIYFGEQTRQYAIVGGPTKELDYAGTGGERTTSYRGKGGVSLDNPLTRAAYALTFDEPQILYSGAIGHGSKILYNRTPKQRVEAVAPWLTIDGDPYPAVVDGRVQWIVDAYTTTNSYPYASRTTLGDTTADSLTDSGRSVVAQQNQVNYIRNSVKATVDAYDGTVQLYQWDTQDPVLKTWMKAFPDTVRPKADIPADLLSHLHYPQDLFKVQRQLLTTYHVTKAAQFYSGSEVWQVPDDPASKSGKAVPPYYLSMKMPGRSDQAFSLTTTFTPNRRGTLAAFMAVDSDATSPDYGTMRILKLPSSAQVEGPQQVQSKLNSNRDFAPDLNLLKRGDSTIEYGNLLTIPLDGGLLYVEPVYVRPADADNPQLQKVMVDFDGTMAFENTLDQALDAVFSSAAPPPAAAPPASGGTAGKQPPASAGDRAAMSAALTDAQQAYDDGQAAMRKGDWKAYGDAQDRLADALRRAREAQKSTR